MNPTPSVIRQRLLARARLRHWLGFARVAELGSVRRAAESIGLAQPALTTMLADLETLLGAPLFERHARGMRLTPLGRTLLPTARRLLAAIDDAAEQADALQRRARGGVRGAAIGGGRPRPRGRPPARGWRAPPGPPGRRRRRHELLVQLPEADGFQLDQMVGRGDVDVALCRAPKVVPDGWRFEPLSDDRLAVIAGAAHPLRRRRRVDLARLRRETWLAMPVGSAARDAFDALFGDDPPPMCGVSGRTSSILWAMLEARPLLALVPASVARQLVAAGVLVELRIERPLPFEPLGALVADGERPEGVAWLLEALRMQSGATA